MMLEAIRDGRNFKRSNTQVSFKDGICRVKLFGNLIFYKKGDIVHYHDAGWPTATTASRLRALGANIIFKRGKSIKIVRASKVVRN